MPRLLRPIDDGLIYHCLLAAASDQSWKQPPGCLPQAREFQTFLTPLAELKERKPFELYR